MYRTRFSEFLKIDFLIIIFADPVKKFEKISKLGMSLINAQILKDTIKLDKRY
ncbi:type ISP restriction/modification enzyme [Borrelia miyamotoi]|uniref:type ISP restriction/modification enzyme n=1 Tax=Borrelia miyamotoi TaxID=47466 RepID=UPI003B284B99